MNEDVCASVLAEGKDGVYLNVHAQPGARRMQLRGLHGDALKIAVQAVAQEGKANRAIVEFVAESLGLPVGRMTLTAGHASRRKRILIEGDAGDIRARIIHWFDHAN